MFSLCKAFSCTDKKRKSNFSHMTGNSEWSSCKVMTNGASLYMGKYLSISSYIRKPFLILSMTLQLPHCEFPLEENLIFFFISVALRSVVKGDTWPSCLFQESLFLECTGRGMEAGEASGRTASHPGAALRTHASGQHSPVRLLKPNS
jgi:hypothetical protein